MGYEQRVKKEALRWSKSLDKRSTILHRTSKQFQTKINKKIPDRIHSIVTESIRTMIKAAMTSSEYIRPVEVDPKWSFQEREEKVKQLLKDYKWTASIEGAGTGVGGLWLGMVDFPLLLSIKMKFLFDAAQIYGLNIHSYEERAYLLHVFMLAYSSDAARGEIKERLIHWDETPIDQKHVDWQTLQVEYRDTLDFMKILQLVPGFGAVVGYVANRRLLEQLGETTIQSCRLRLI
ncbi:EcsC family protein [Halobacillus litoralis]|uniref:EcsC family protein n=1 Tax=Halobacillus litoralis TaxID=45668 RepID=UPI001CFC9EDF|nr:EcsC family protein [Halobacillus litoralis]